MRYDWATGGLDYLQAFGMIPRNAAIAGYITGLSEKPGNIMDVACGLCPIIPFLPEKIISRYVAFDNDRYVQENMPYKELKCFEFYMASFDEFFADKSFQHASFDFVLYLGMYGGFNVYAKRLEKLLPYVKPDGYLILEAIDEFIPDGLLVIQQKYPDYKEIASCNIQVQSEGLSNITREKLRSIHLYQYQNCF